jgi:hypothetical protein
MVRFSDLRPATTRERRRHWRGLMGLAGAFALLAVFPLSASASGFAYVPDENTSTISQFSVGSNGLLTPLAPASIPVVNYVTGYQEAAAISPNGRSLYMGDFTGIEMYTSGSNGTLTSMSPAWLLAPNCTYAVANAVAVSASGKYVYLSTACNGGTIVEYLVGTNGLLIAQPGTNGTVTALGSVANGITISPNGEYLYANTDSQIESFRIGDNGQLTPNPAGSLYNAYFNGFTGDLVLSPNGKSAYIPAGNAIQEMNVAANGTLSLQSRPVVEFATGYGQASQGLAVSADGHSLYVTDGYHNTVNQLAIAANGSLTRTTDVVPTGGTNPGSVTISPDGKTVYVTCQGSPAGVGSAISVYSVGAGGVLTPEASPAIGNESPETVVLARH